MGSPADRRPTLIGIMDVPSVLNDALDLFWEIKKELIMMMFYVEINPKKDFQIKN